MTRLLAGSAALGALVVLALSCDSSFFLRGTINGDCDPPRTIIPADGGSGSGTLRVSNCQAPNAVCCRRSAKAARTSCQYPEDCYVAPFEGACATAVDCADTQTCTGGTCQCVGTGPSCEDPTTHVVICCPVGTVCTDGACGMPLDGGT